MFYECVIILIHLNTMKAKALIIPLVLVFLFSGRLSSFGDEFEYIEQLFELRTSITDQGQALPDIIKQTTGNDLRTLERIFELNTSALTTIEAYFRIVKIAFVTDEGINNETAPILNEWLAFIRNQCKYDSDFLDETLKETNDPAVKKHIILSKKNVERLSSLALKGISVNKSLQ